MLLSTDNIIAIIKRFEASCIPTMNSGSNVNEILNKSEIRLLNENNCGKAVICSRNREHSSIAIIAENSLAIIENINVVTLLYRDIEKINWNFEVEKNLRDSLLLHTRNGMDLEVFTEKGPPLMGFHSALLVCCAI